MAWYFGSDDATTTNSCGMSFYLGRLGGGIKVAQYWFNENYDIPAFAYWNIHGTGSQSNLQEWGAQQANVFWDQYANGQYPPGQPGYTIFGAISSGSGGWTSGNYGPNQDVVTGFLNQLASNIASSPLAGAVTLGLYGSQTNEFGDLLDAANWQAPQPVVIWTADALSSLPDCAGVEAEYCQMPTLCGYFPMIWQYFQNPDYDITPYAGGPENLKWNPTKPPGICS